MSVYDLLFGEVYVKSRMAILTVSSCSPKTDALERIVLSIKLSAYVTNKRGISLMSILRSTRLAMAASTPWTFDSLTTTSCWTAMVSLS